MCGLVKLYNDHKSAKCIIQMFCFFSLSARAHTLGSTHFRTYYNHHNMTDQEAN
jgi:hypothetical protein